MSDLPERMIAQYADLLIFIYRDEVYDPHSIDKGTVELIIGRNRHDPIGTIKVEAKLQFGKFSNYGCGS